MRLTALVIWIGLILVSPVVFYMGFEIFSPAADGVSPVPGNPAQSDEDALAASANPEHLSIRAIKGRGVPAGDGAFYATTGYVVNKYPGCAPCPRGAQCKLCPQPSILLSEENKPKSFDALGEADLAVMLGPGHSIDGFQEGGKYMVVVKVSGLTAKGGGPIQWMNTGLVSSTPVR